MFRDSLRHIYIPPSHPSRVGAAAVGDDGDVKRIIHNEYSISVKLGVVTKDSPR